MKLKLIIALSTMTILGSTHRTINLVEINNQTGGQNFSKAVVRINPTMIDGHIVATAPGQLPSPLPVSVAVIYGNIYTARPFIIRIQEACRCDYKDHPKTIHARVTNYYSFDALQTSSISPNENVVLSLDDNPDYLSNKNALPFTFKLMPKK